MTATPTDLTIHHGQALTEADMKNPDKLIAHLMEFDSVSALMNVIRMYGYNPTEETAYLIDIIRNTESDSVRLKALSELKRRRTDALINCGALVEATRTARDPEGNSLTFRGTAITSLLNPLAESEIPRSNHHDPEEENCPNLPVPDPETEPGPGPGPESEPDPEPDLEVPDVPCILNKPPVDASSRRGITSGAGGKDAQKHGNGQSALQGRRGPDAG